MASLLLIETSTEVCSVALSEGATLVHVIEAEGRYTHGSQLTLVLEELLQTTGRAWSAIDGIAVSSGPGSYTALRVGFSVAKGLCYGLGLPLLAVPTLEAIADTMRVQTESRYSIYAAMLDARRMEVYLGLYGKDGAPLREDEAVVVEEGFLSEFQSSECKICLGGPGAEKTKAVLPAESFVWLPLSMSASMLVEGAQRRYDQQQFEDLAYCTPTYIKPPNITKPKKKWF